MLQLPLSLLLMISTVMPPAFSDGVVSSKLVKTKEAVAVYQTPNQAGSLTVSSASKTQVQFYLFDIEGHLVYQNRFQAGEQQIIKGLSAGTYTYHAFQADKQLKGGQVQLKN